MAAFCKSFAESTALKGYEEDIIDSLESADLEKLSRVAGEMGVITQDVKKNFDSLDPNVPSAIKIRYLLLHAYKQLEADPRLCERWLKLLGKHGVTSTVIDEVKQKITGYYYSEVSDLTMHHAEGVGDILCSDKAIALGEKRPLNKCNYFLPKHVSVLTEILADNASKWENIGTSLRVPEDVLTQLTLRYIAFGGTVCLKKVLSEWITGNHEHAKKPTVQNLEKALSSKIVGLGLEASQLRENLHKQLNDEESSVSAKRPCLEAPPLQIVRQSLNTVVTEEKSTLLEVQVATRHDTDVTYQWVKDGCPLQKGGEFLGVHDPILYITNASSAIGGTYVCETMEHQNSDSPVCSKPMLLTVSIPPLKTVLVDRYSAQPEVPEDSWPPVSNNTYINLALIKQGNIEKAGEYARSTIQGNMDDVMTNKEGIEYEEAFTGLESGARLLIEGRPGSGKTTLVHKFSQDWARGNHKLDLQKIKLLFLVHLRGFFNDPDINLRDILRKYYAKDSTIEKIIQDADEHSGEGLCFVLDGLDEYSPKQKGTTFIFRLIKKDVFPKAIVIVASRPAASARLRKVATKQIEVLGFLKEQIFEYVEKYTFSQTEKTCGLHKYLEHHPNVHHMCYLPIHTAMVCYLYDVMGSKLPRTETEMYTEFTKHTLLRTFMNCNRVEDTCLECLDDLPTEDMETFLKICQLGYEQTISSKQVMKKTEVKDFFKDVSGGKESMGLITVDCMARICGFENLYTFLHLTFQEYLAAYHISKLDEEKQTEMFVKHGHKKHMQVVWKFYCGLVHFDEGNITKFSKLMETTQIKKVKNDDLFLTQCAFESRQPITCDYVVKSVTLSFNSNYLTPSDFTAIGYVLKNTTCPVEKLVLDHCNLGQDCIAAFLEEAWGRVSLLRTLCFHGGACGKDQFDSLNRLLKDSTNLEHFDISYTDLGVAKVECLTSGVVLHSLHTLVLSRSCSNVGKLKFCSSKLEQVVIHGSVGMHHIKAFGLLLITRGTNLQTLEFARNSIGPDGAKVLADGLQHCHNLQTLNLSSNNIGPDGAKVLADGLQHCHNLQTLNLNWNKIDPDGAKVLADGLQHCHNLQTLYLCDNNIGLDGAKALADGLQHCHNLQTLYLDWNNIGPDGAKALAYGLQHLHNFRTLILYNNSINPDDEKAIKELLPHKVRV